MNLFNILFKIQKNFLIKIIDNNRMNKKPLSPFNNSKVDDPILLL